MNLINYVYHNLLLFVHPFYLAIFLVSVTKYPTESYLRDENPTLPDNLRASFHYGGGDMAPGREGMTTGAEGHLITLHLQ